MLERPVAERPQHDALEGIMDWLAGPAQQVGVPSLIGEFDEFAWRMLAAGFPLLRATLQLRTLHPQIYNDQINSRSQTNVCKLSFALPKI
jgi:hypothetical protein